MSNCNFGSKTFTIAAPSGKSCNFGSKTFTIAAPSPIKWGLWMHWNDLANVLSSSSVVGTMPWWIAQIGKQMPWIGAGAWMYPVNADGSPKDYRDPSLANQVNVAMNEVNNSYLLGGIPVFMWSPAQCHPDLVPFDNSLFYNQMFINGTYDVYFTALANAFKNDGREIHIRMFHEMNTQGYPGFSGFCPFWSPNYWLNATEFAKRPNGTRINTSATFKAMWQHIVTIFRNVGANNVKFWFTVGSWPSNAFFPPHVWNDQIPLSNYYPGDAYVDYLGFELYNARVTAPFDDATHTYGYSYSAVKGEYDELCALSANKPLVLAEMGCKDGSTDGTLKPAWIANTLNPVTLKALFPRLAGLMYWDDESNSDGTWGLRNTVADQTAAINAFKLAGFKNGI